MPTLTFTWNTFWDNRTCNKCKALQGYVWTFKDEFPQLLEHPKYGVVWDLVADQSRAHGLAVWNCRCHLTIEIDDSDLTKELEIVKRKKKSLDETLASCHNAVQTILSALEGHT